MATLYYRTLNRDLKNALKNRQIPDAQLKEVVDNFKEEKKKTVKRVNIIMIIVTIIMLVVTMPAFSQNKAPQFIIYMLGMVLLVMAVIYVLTYFALIGLMTTQFNSALKKGYPEYAMEYKA